MYVEHTLRASGMNDSERYPSLWDLTSNKYDQPPIENHDLKFILGAPFFIVVLAGTLFARELFHTKSDQQTYEKTTADELCGGYENVYISWPLESEGHYYVRCVNGKRYEINAAARTIRKLATNEKPESFR